MTNEIACYALTIPTEEILNYWLIEGKMPVLSGLKGLVGVNPDGPANHLLFLTKKDRVAAYKAIHREYPETLCAYAVAIAYVDKRYLEMN